MKHQFGNLPKGTSHWAMNIGILVFANGFQKRKSNVRIFLVDFFEIELVTHQLLSRTLSIWWVVWLWFL